jgi:isopentenyl-diphosphate delta-isomerase
VGTVTEVTTISAGARSGYPDEVVLLAEDGTPTGETRTRADVHTDSTPLHLAFSCHLLDGRGRVLVTRRALSKRTWPGVWTGSFCGHPRPGEPIEDAVRRHARHELGIDRVGDLTPLIPDFRYRATDDSGVVENEVCPVFSARTAETPRPHPEEVAAIAWVELDDLIGLIERTPWVVSPWLVLQVDGLRRLRAAI